MKTTYKIILAIVLIGLIIGLFITFNTENKQTTDTVSTERNTTISQKAQSYINDNYPGYTIVKASDDPMCTGEPAIDVLMKKNQDIISLIFSPDGDFLQSEVDVNYSEAPQEIDSMLKSEFSEYTASEQIEKLTLPNGENQYLVDITKGKESREVIFDAAANIVCTN